MIELCYKDGTERQIESSADMVLPLEGLIRVCTIDATSKELKVLCENFGLDLSIFASVGDIELSSHYINTPEQLAFNITVPHYTESIHFAEEEFIFIIRNNIIFYFLSGRVQESLTTYKQIESLPTGRAKTLHWYHFFYQLAIVSDYYADLTELITSKIKVLYLDILSKREYAEKDLDVITILKLNNHLIKSSVNRFQRILLLLEKSDHNADVEGKLHLELQDLAVVSEHVQYNFDRLDGLKENINIKINLEQNKIFRTLTVITVCISLPTLMAGIYGMNFKNMPELNWPHGYWLILGTMFLVFVGALFFFKKKKWIR